MGSGMRHRAEKVALVAMAVGGVTAVVADQLGLLDQLSGNALPRITLLVLSTVTLFLLLEVGRFQTLDSIEARLSKLDIDSLAEKQKNEHYAGVVQIHRRFTEGVEEAFTRYIDAARVQVTILQTWVPNLHRFEQALTAAIKRGVEVRILLLFPNSNVAYLRDQALGEIRDPELAENVEDGVNRCLALLDSISRSTKDTNGHRKDCLKVRVYNSLPSISVYRADEHYFVSVFPHGRLAIDSPQLEIGGTNTLMGDVAQHELDTLWAIGYDIPLDDWRDSLQRIHPRHS